ncbi:MAG: right-handed parallel beta-helix repeat-containing protein [Bacteroidota bacterium]
MPNKFYSILVLAILPLTIFSQNLISNAGFEEGLAGWSIGTWGGASATSALSTDLFNAGQAAAAFTVTEAVSDDIFKAFIRKENLALESGGEYKLTFSAMTNDRKEGRIDVVLYSHPNIGGNAWGMAFEEKNMVLKGDGAWQTFEFTFLVENIGGNPDFGALGLMFGVGFGARTYYIDDVALTAVGGQGTGVNTQAKTYFVSKSGDDANDGTANQPFLTINQAAALAKAGDTILIGEGTYRETVKPAASGTEGHPILYKAQTDAEVIISGMEPLADWTVANVGQFQTKVDWTLGDGNMLMYDGQLCDLARWPNNEDHDPFTIDARSVGNSGDLTTFKATIPNNDWANGGTLWFLGNNRWTSWRQEVKAFNPTTDEITFQGPSGWEGNAHNPKDGGEFILFGAKDALDFALEFYYDNNTQTIMLQTPDNQKPVDEQVEMKKRTLGFDLTSRKYTTLEGIEFYGCAIKIAGSATGNIIQDCKVFWGNHSIAEGSAAIVNEQSIELRGSNNLVERCEIAYGAHSGIWLAGTDNIVRNNIIHDFNYLASYAAPVMLRGGERSLVTQNTIYNGGRDLVQFFSNNSELSYNNLYNSNMINDDCGPIYVCCGDFNNSVHHNFIHSSDSRGSKFKAAAVYLDNSTQHFTVHHNIIVDMEWTAFQINWDGWYLDIYNNTVWNVDKTMGAWLPSDKFLKDVRVFNNLTNDREFVGTDIDKNLVVDTSPFVDLANHDFRLKADSEAVDFGKMVDGIDLEMIGTAPDAGALEQGLPIFIPGATWIEPVFTTAIEDVKIVEKGQLKVSPNPTTQFIAIEINQNQSGDLYIFDQSGKEILQTLDYQNGQIVPVEQFKAGVYFVYIKVGERLMSSRFIKM